MIESIEVPRPASHHVDDLDVDYDDVSGLNGDLNDRCQATDCCTEGRAHIGWTETSYEDTYGVDHEGIRWVTAWRLPDGRLVCEDDDEYREAQIDVAAEIRRRTEDPVIA